MDSKKARLTTTNPDNKTGVDRISSLPDELLHYILSFSDAKLAVQTSVLSKRWKLVWTTLPFLNFAMFRNSSSFTSHIKFVEDFIIRRNNDTDVLKLNLSFNCPPESRTPLVDNCINYAISHNVRVLNVDIPGIVYLDDIELSRPNYLSCTTLNKLVLKLNFGEFWEESNRCWRLPALTTLHLIRPNYSKPYKLPESYLVSLPSLQTLLLDGFDLPNSVSLPALQTLVLHVVEFPKNMSEFCRVFQALGNLQNLTLFFWTTLRADCVLDCPHLVNLEINYCTSKTVKSIVTSESGEIMVLAPKIRNFSSVGIFPIKFGVFRLENVSIQLPDSAGIKIGAPSTEKEIFYCRVEDMFRELGGAKILTLDLKTIEALSALSDILVRGRRPPFLSLEYVKVPHGFKESSMSSYLKWYLLGSCSRASIVTTLPQKCRPASMPVVHEIGTFTDRVFNSRGDDQQDSNQELNEIMLLPANYVVEFKRLNNKLPELYPSTNKKIKIPCRKAASVTAQNVVLQDPLTAPTKVLAGYKKLGNKVCVDTMDMGVQEEHVVKNSVANADRVTHVSVLVEETGKGQMSPSTGNSGFDLWRGHEVNSDFVCLLDIIMAKYPETFEHFTTTNKKLCTMKLNMLCSSVNVFTKLSMTQVDTEMILEHRSVFTALQNLGFNVSWLVNRLNYIEQLRFSQPLLPELHAIDSHIDNAKSKLHDLQTLIDDAKIELRDLHTLRAEKMQEIQKAFGTMGTNLLVGCIGDDLLSVP